MHSSRLIFAPLALALGLVAPLARAGTPEPSAAPSAEMRAAQERAAAAEALFEQGRRLMDAGRYAEACDKLTESERIDHGVGTLLNLADCYEMNGQTASAWAGFRAAAVAASAEGQVERERIARARERLLEPLLGKLTIVIPRAHVAPDLVVKRDHRVLDRSLWGVAVPVDAGEHTLEVSAPGKRTYERTIKVPKRGGAWIVASVPALDDEPDPAAAKRPRPAPASPSSLGGQRLVGVVLGGFGLASVVAASALGVHAMSRNQDSALHCAGDLCDAEGVELRRAALRAGTASTLAFVVAGAAVTAGAALYFTAPKFTGSRRASFSASAVVGISPSGSGLFLQGSW